MECEYLTAPETGAVDRNAGVDVALLGAHWQRTAELQTWPPPRVEANSRDEMASPAREVSMSMTALLSPKQARALDTKIRAANARLVDLVEQAARGQINAALNCSWRAWFADAVLAGDHRHDGRESAGFPKVKKPPRPTSRSGFCKAVPPPTPRK